MHRDVNSGRQPVLRRCLDALCIDNLAVPCLRLPIIRVCYGRLGRDWGTVRRDAQNCPTNSLMAGVGLALVLELLVMLWELVDVYFWS